MIPTRLTALLVSVLFALPAMAQTSEDEAPPPEVTEAQEVRWAPPSAGKDGFTWVQLVSDEWVKGEIKDLRDGNLSFDSDELDQFDYDWADVKAVISSEPHTVTTWDKQVHTGFIVARQDQIRVLDENGNEVAIVAPDQVSSMIQGFPRERNFWSGSLSWGSTVRSGNSDQSDFSTLVRLNRRALISRWDNTANVSGATSNNEKTQESQRYTSKFDWFISRNFFVTVASYEFFRDPFQNIRQRHTPGAGFGYDNYFLRADWDVGIGVAWQKLDYESAAAGAESSVEDWVGRIATNFEWDLTSDIEWDLSYSINVPFEDANFYTSNLLTTLSLDVWWNFEFDFTFAWDRQNNPQVREDNTRPEKDDYRLTTGIAWDF